MYAYHQASHILVCIFVCILVCIQEQQGILVGCLVALLTEVGRYELGERDGVEVGVDAHDASLARPGQVAAARLYDVHSTKEVIVLDSKKIVIYSK